MPGRNSFSLVELVSVLAIISLLAGVSLVSISVIPSRQTQVTARKVAFDLCWARTLAFTQNSDYCVRFYTDSGKFFADVHKGDCSSTDIVQHSFLRSPIVSPGSDFELEFKTHEGAVAEGGSADYDGSGRLDIDFSSEPGGTNGWRVSVFESTAAVTVAQW